MKARAGAGIVLTLSLLFILFAADHVAVYGKTRYATEVKRYQYARPFQTVIGYPLRHEVTREDTLLDIARDNGLGINELSLLYPDMDPWLPPVGEQLLVPTFWVLPELQTTGIVINLPEMRLYFFQKDRLSVQTYPVAIGRKGFETPQGSFFITGKRKNPTWYIPESLRKEYGIESMPPGPGNPMGRFMMKFSAGAYAIHGTHMAWGVGRLVSHGCIRTYPEHIRLLFPQVGMGTGVKIIYEPIKFGERDNQIFVEIHPDLYDRIPDFERFARDALRECSLSDFIDPVAYEMAVKAKNGVPTDVTDPIKILSRAVSRNEAVPSPR